MRCQRFQSTLGRSSPHRSRSNPIDSEWSPIGDCWYHSIEIFLPQVTMSDLDRGIMKFKGADSPLAIVVSSTLVLGGITIMIIWAIRHAYAV